MSLPPYATPPPPSYIDEEGRPHYITQDGLPPNNGVPPPPGFWNPPYPVNNTPPTLPFDFLSPPIYSPPTDTAPPPPFYTEDGRVYSSASQSTAAEPFIQPLRTSNFQPTPNLQPTSAVNYIHINFIRDSIRPHRDRYTGRDRNNLIPFTLTKVATYMRMEDLILIMGHGDLSGMTECKKSTDGRSWSEVQTFQIGDDKSNKSLQDLGWTGSKGTAESPIWVCVYRPDLEEEEERIYWERLGFPAE